MSGTRFTRAELYEFVWTDPMSTIAPQFGLSGVALRKACIKARVPVPPRGHWAKKAAGKPTGRSPLPPRPAGMADEITIGGRHWHAYVPWTEAELLGPVPDPPVFDESVDALRERVRKQIGRVGVARSLSKTHPSIAAVLEEDERRREKRRNSLFASVLDEPIYETPLARRRLRILNALFNAVARAGGKGRVSVDGTDSETIAVVVHEQHVVIGLNPVPDRRRRSGAEPKAKRKQILRLAILRGHRTDSERVGWQDDEVPLENRIAEVAAEVVVTAEVQYREHCMRLHEWRIQRKAELEAERRRREVEAERKRQEHEAALAQARIDRLLSQARAMRDAQEIRAYVQAACSSAEGASLDPGIVNEWRAWALAQADGLDPVKSGSFLEELHGDASIPTEHDEVTM
jgi:hypothetical protein